MSDVPPEAAGEGQPSRRNRLVALFAGLGVFVIGAIIAIAAFSGAFGGNAEPEEAPTPTVAAPEETPAVTPTPTPAEPTETTPPPPPPEPRVDIPSVQQMAYSPVWNPPDNGQYFWQIVDPAHGYPEDGGTDFLLAHACESQNCAGDELRKLEVGDSLTYRGETYIIEDKRQIMKVDIAAQDIWFHDPNRLVIITCIIETTWDQSDKNDLFIATKYSPV